MAGGGGGQGSSTSYAGSPSGTNYNSSKKLYGADASSGGGGGSGYYGGNGGSGGAGGGGGTCYTGGVSNGTTTQGERSGHGFARITYDTTPPNQTSTALTTIDWTSVNANAAGTRSWTAATDVGTGLDVSGVKGYNVRWNGSTTYQTGTSYTPAALSAAGIYNLEIQTVDNAGNTSAYKTILTYKYDPNAPGQSSTGLTTVDWTNVNADAAGARTWTAATDIGTVGTNASGIKGYNVRWNGATTLQTGTSYTPTALTAAGIYNLEIQTVDNAGNTSAYKTILTYKYDPDAPNQTGTALTTVEWTSANVSAMNTQTWAAAADAGTAGTNASGVRGYNVRWNGTTTFQTGTLFTPTALTAAGIYNLEIQTVDNAGNTSAFKTILIYKFDNDIPGKKAM
ncbi:MAG: hypothetical protein LBD62_03965, partial [Candidatus Margulisbacteria bacterium]|nr:hypothetical protein [Candidatus Margulisiibacteriota bacterium]